MRTPTAAAAVLLAACACLGPLSASAAAPAPLVVSTTRTVAPATVTLGGSCPAEAAPGGPSVPGGTVLSLDNSGVGPWKVDLDPTGAFADFAVDVPDTTAPGDYAFTTRCGGAAPFTVLAAPSLQVRPDSARAGAATVATGTCSRRFRQLELQLDGAPLGTAPLSATGEFGPLSFDVPGAAAVGPHAVTTSCGGRTVLTVLAAPVPVPVPTTRTSTPTPPVVVPPASGSTTIVVGIVILLLALLAAALLAVRAGRARRRRRERRWLQEHLVVAPGRAYLQLSEVPRGPVPGVDVQIVAHREAVHLEFQGVRDD